MSRAVSGDADAEGDATTVRDLSEREVRALTEYLVALPPRLAPGVAPGSGLYHVTGESGSSYVVDPLLGSCTCPDAKYRETDEPCKHVCRVQFETGERPFPVDTLGVPRRRGHDLGAVARLNALGEKESRQPSPATRWRRRSASTQVSRVVSRTTYNGIGSSPAPRG